MNSDTPSLIDVGKLERRLERRMMQIVIRAFSFLLLALISFASTVEAAPASQQIKKGAERYTQAVLRKDWNACLVVTPTRAVTFMGGRQAVLTMIRQGIEDSEAKGIVLEKLIVGEPSIAKKYGKSLAALIPETVVMKAPLGHLQTTSYLLALSEDDGKKWSYLDLGLWEKNDFVRAFPELRSFPFPKISLPSYQLD